MITRRESYIISAYRGYLLGTFSDMHEQIDQKFGRPVWTHEMADRKFEERLRELSKPDFLAIKVDGVTVDERGIPRAEGSLPD